MPFHSAGSLHSPRLCPCYLFSLVCVTRAASRLRVRLRPMQYELGSVLSIGITSYSFSPIDIYRITMKTNIFTVCCTILLVLLLVFTDYTGMPYTEIVCTETAYTEIVSRKVLCLAIFRMVLLCAVLNNDNITEPMTCAYA